MDSPGLLNERNTTLTTPCGGHGHSPECLCDVVITDSVPVNYHFDQVWHAGIVARAVGYRGHGGAELADFLEALASGYDATRSVAMKDGAWLDGTIADDLKARVEEQLQDGHSILDLPEILGQDLDRIVAALTGCQPCLIWTWDEVDWLEFEAFMYRSPIHSQSKMAASFGLTRAQCTTLIKAYGRGIESDSTASRTARAWELFAEYPNMPNAELQAMLAAEGHMYSRDGIRVARQRWKHRMKAAAYAAATAGMPILLTACRSTPHK
jgi:hypothetical protein